MASDGQIVFEVTADGKHAIADIKEITRAIQQETGKWDAAAEKASSGMESKFSGMLKKLAAGFSAVKIGKALLDLGKDALQAASDLQEVQNVVDTTFGGNANKIEAWAKDAGTQFGLTEIQAKKFTSTMGAMLKSSGLAGDQIVEVSTDLAGLAADMASFYNLDFEEAFSKIRSGMSGMTMPLKELGIDMSVDTMNAFALARGLEKTYSQMTQSEQTMLRYQYLMQATADAQGDFARTSDGYANSIRQLETNLTSLKTNIGTYILPIVNDLVGAINSLFEDRSGQKTVLDDFAGIDAQTEKKLEQIAQTAADAQNLTAILEEIGASNAGDALARIASGANSLNASSPETWQKIASALSNVNGLENVFGSDSKAVGNITALAEALSSSTVDTNKADAWKTFLDTLSENADAVSKLTGKSVDETVAWLSGLSQAAKGIDASDAAAWDSLLKTLVDGLSVTADGKAFAESIGILATGANALDASAPSTWTTLFNALKDIDGLSNIFGSDDAGANIESLAKALSDSNVDSNKADAWKTFLGTLSDNADAVSKLTGKDVGETVAWLTGLADAATKIDASDADAWDALLTTLVEGLTVTDDGKAFAESIGILATGANALDSSAPSTWTSLFNALKNVDGLSNIFSNDNAGTNVQALANALSSSEIDTSKADAWKTFLGALAENIDVVSAMTGESAEGTAAWLKALSDAANDIDQSDVTAWSELLTTLATGLAGDTPEGKKFLEGMATELLAMGKDSEAAVNGLKALGFGTDEISDKQKKWLKTCKELTKTIPGLSEVINTETGEVTGGIGALDKYVDEWKQTQEKLLRWKAYYAKQEAQQEAQNQIYSLEVEAGGARKAIERQKQKLDELRKTLGVGNDEYEMIIKTNATGGQGILTDAEKQWNDAIVELGKKRKEAADAEEKYTRSIEANAEAIQKNKDEYDYLVETYGEVANKTNDVAKAMTTLERAANGEQDAVDEITNAVENANSALKELADYTQSVYDSVHSAVESNISGFERITTLAEENVKDLQKQLDKLGDKTVDNAKEWDKLSQAIEKAQGKKTTTSAQEMGQNLKEQAQYMDDYLKALEKARKKGVSEEVLAQLSDGSVESYNYLQALAGATNDDVKNINKNYEKVAEGKKKLEEELSKTRLKGDETFKTLQEKAVEAVKALDQATPAAENGAKTVAALAEGIASNLPSVQSAVDSILEQLGRLSGYSVSIDLGGMGKVEITTSGGYTAQSGNRFGLANVPFDGYLARLHEGERVLTAQENQIYSALLHGGVSGFDLDSLGGVMRDNIRPGGNVYLNGREVGKVISDQQGKAYKSLNRSGWQS